MGVYAPKGMIMFGHSAAWSFGLLSGLIASIGCNSADGDLLFLTETELVIPQVNYEPAIYYAEGDPYPHLDFAKVKYGEIVSKVHRVVVMENEYVRLTLLPAMGRVYSLVYKPTGHEVFWRNDIVTVGPGQNDAGWWIWIGGAEYTLPGDEHGTTWALPWDWEIAEDSLERKAVRMRVKEPGTGLEESLEIALFPERADYEAEIIIANPTDSTAHYAHWINAQWTPGGRNELTDNTEFIIPTDRILIEERWQKNLGPSPQPWAGNPLRFIRGWKAMGDLMADGLRAGFYSAYSHDEAEGVVRVFDPEDTPGVDIWTYGYHTTQIPMGSGAPSQGYAEMWGGTSRTFPHERKPLAPGGSVRWKEWMVPYHGTGGLTFADRDLAVNFVVEPGRKRAEAGICPSRPWQGTAEVWISPMDEEPGRDQRLQSWGLDCRPDRPCRKEMWLEEAGGQCEQLSLRLRETGTERWHVIRPECDR